MLKQIVNSPNQQPSLFKPFSSCKSLTLMKSLSARRRCRAPKSSGIRCTSSDSSEAVEAPQALLTAMKSPTMTVKAIVTVKVSMGGTFAHMGIARGLDDIGDLLGRSLLLELVSAELDPKTGEEKETVAAYAHKIKSDDKEKAKYEGEFSFPNDFGEIGAVLIENEHHKEMYVKEIVLMTGDDTTTALTFDCRSWVHSKFDNPEKRIFFPIKSYLPSETPSGIQKWRKRELELLRGDGTGERKHFERIYDYDTYNDLGDPNIEGRARPVIGGSKELPYPRRCRTGRPKTKKDPLSEERRSNIYVPRDEAFSEVKQRTFSVKTLRSVLHTLVPSIKASITDKMLGFSKFTHIDKLFTEGLTLSSEDVMTPFNSIIPRLVKTISADDVLRFETPAMMHRDKFSWFRDEEFGRQTLAGLNPLSIQSVTEFPFVSKLDPEIYGSSESAITEQVIERHIKGDMTFKEAMEQKKLFVLDYHDLLLPFVHKVRELENTTLYASRTVFFLTPEGSLRPIAIELTRPASPTKPQWKQVFTHSWDATGTWLWRLAKAHVCAQDAGYHQLVSHWLRTHACTEPYVIAASRQLSAVHPIYQLLRPHFRYTLEINALAREHLINHGGIIETSFAPGKYSMELSSVAYAKQWRFDMEALPADLIRRGMAVEDPTAEHGLRLTVEDYPYASDGLLIWSSIKQWVTDYVNKFYSSPTQVQEDYELQEWWTEVRTKGHGDKKDEPWWPVLNTQEDLIQVLTTIIWITSGLHAAVNFGQYHYGGYFPNRPTITRLNMPVEDEHGEEYEKFMKKPESTLLRCFPTQVQATVVMSILDVLSNHSPDEEYLSQVPESAWAMDPVLSAAFERFHGRMKEIEGIIDGRNANPELRNRCGAGICPYELLKPFSEQSLESQEREFPTVSLFRHLFELY